MKRILNLFGIIIGALCVSIIALNTCVRVAETPSRSYGVVEGYLFDGPFSDVFRSTKSKNMEKWVKAFKESDKVGRLLIEYDTQALLFNASLRKEKNEAMQASQIAYNNASSIPKDFLKDLDPELPDKFYQYFVPAMEAWSTGFKQDNFDQIEKGIFYYNQFLFWSNSKDPKEFR